MKKNLIFRAVGILLILVLATTCVISGTFAKYATGADAEASARAAKWGVEISVTGDDVFKNEYENDGHTITVKSIDDADVVAPGTTGKAVFALDGTPEVMVKVMLQMDSDFSEIFLKAGDYMDYTTEKEDDTFSLDRDYYPVKWTLKQVEDASGPLATPDVLVNGGSLTQVKEQLDIYSGTGGHTYAPGTDLKAKFELIWEWPFETGSTPEQIAMFNKADTLLGNLAADASKCFMSDGTTPVPSANYNLTTGYKITIGAEQVD